MDTDTGAVRVVKLAAVDDVGTVVNPLTLEGQLHGSTAQGLGETLLEQIVYERRSGQLMTGSFQDYAMPRADNMPPIESSVRPVPTQLNPLGAKAGRTRKCWRTAAIINAIVDALSPYKVTDVPMPATSERKMASHPRSARIRGKQGGRDSNRKLVVER